MADMKPISFDIETSGFSEDAVITVAGFATNVGAWLCLNTGGRSADEDQLESTVEEESDTVVNLVVKETERALLQKIGSFIAQKVNTDERYIAAYNGERWKGGFDLPFLRRACLVNNVDWPFADCAYVDVMNVIQRIDTGDSKDLEGVYNVLIGDEHCDPFADSEEAVDAWEKGKIGRAHV